MNLYELTTNQLALIQELVDNGGEVTPRIETELALNKEALEAKGLGYGFVVKQLESEVDVIDAEIKRLQAMKSSRNNAIERLKTSLSTAMQVYEVNELKSPTLKISFRKSESIEVEDVNSLPSEYKVVKVTEQADKVALKEAIKSGEEIFGVTLKVNQNIQIK